MTSKTEEAFVEHVLQNERGMYYVYDQPLLILPGCFESREVSRYLGATERVAAYGSAKESLVFVADWLKHQRNSNGKWDMDKSINDKVYFPLSDNWRKKKQEKTTAQSVLAICYGYWKADLINFAFWLCIDKFILEGI